MVTVDPAFGCHKNHLIQRHRNVVGGNVVLDIFRNAPSEGLDGEPKYSSLDGEAVSGPGVVAQLKRTLDVKRGDQDIGTNAYDHAARKTVRHIQQFVAVVNLRCSSE